MPSTGSVLSWAAALSTAQAAYQGFNYGATFTDGTIKQESDFEAEFKAAQSLAGTDGAFTSARLFTMVQGESNNDPISAIPAAIKTKTSMLFGMWASAGDEAFGNEISALEKTIDEYCGDLDDLVVGISVGSEDLYRISPIGIENDENPGAGPDVLVRYIKRVRDTIKGTCLSDAPIGHVDTWTAYANSSNSPLIDAVDWVGMDAYAYFENTKPNSIENGADLFQAALQETKNAAGDKEVWITETGWPVDGPKENDAVASAKNAERFWNDVGCPNFGSTNIWWYILRDSNVAASNPSFGVLKSDLSGGPRYDLSCDGSNNDDDDDDKSSSTKSSEPKPTETETKEPSKKPTEAPGSSVSVPSSEASEPASDAPTTHKPVPIPTVSVPGNGTESIPPAPMPTVSLPSGESPSPEPTGEEPGAPGQPGEPEPSGTDGGSGEAPSNPPESGSYKVNSLGAAVVAIVLAVTAF